MQWITHSLEVEQNSYAWVQVAKCKYTNGSLFGGLNKMISTNFYEWQDIRPETTCHT